MKHQFKNKKAFTLIELLIVIAIIGILFIVLISKVDFATDKAKATGVQTDFRSFQVAIESVALENAGLATFGWDTGDTNGNRIRDSYDKGDTNQNGVQDEGEVFVGSKAYGETWTNVYTLTNPADADDKSAIAALEAAINKNLDPKLHITIADDLTITMANGAQDPWNTEYHGYYITNALNDGKDRGAIVMYSNGANQEFGSEHSIAGGVVTVNVPGNNVYGKDDYGMAVIYTYVNGYGEIKTTTSGFSVNQTTQGNVSNNSGTEGTEETEDPGVTELLEPGLYETGAIALVEAGDIETAQDMIKTSWDDLLTAGVVYVTDGVVYSNLDFDTWQNASSDALDGDLVLPNDGSITKLGNYREWWDENNNWFYDGQLAFTYCYNLTGIAISKGVTSISDFAFYECTSLTNVTIPDGVTSIGGGAFQYCLNLTSIAIPDSVTSIREYAFAYCESLTNITIPNNVTEICMSVFSDCSSLKSIVIPSGVTSIGDYAFAYCYELSSITIPESVTSIGKWAFNCCTSLPDITIPNGVTSIGERVFGQCDSLTSVTIPDSVTSIGLCAFVSCKGLTSITIGNGLTSIGERAFWYCSSLTSISFGENSKLTSIGPEAFRECTGLMNIALPDSITSINRNAFYDTGYSNNNTNWENNVLYIGKYLIDAKESKISGAYTIKDGTLCVADYAFLYCEKLTSVVMPDSLTNIGEMSFRYCSKLTSVVMSNSLENIGYCAFGGCTSLASITIPNSLTNMDDSAFNDCMGLTSITYSGTKDQWNSIKIGYGWNVRVPATYVQCTDGQVTLE